MLEYLLNGSNETMISKGDDSMVMAMYHNENKRYRAGHYGSSGYMGYPMPENEYERKATTFK